MNSVDDHCLAAAGLPHSEIVGLTCICHYPTLIAAYRVLHRLSVPRHPSCALCSLTTENVLVSFGALDLRRRIDHSWRPPGLHQVGSCRAIDPLLSYPMRLSKNTAVVAC